MNKKIITFCYHCSSQPCLLYILKTIFAAYHIENNTPNNKVLLVLLLVTLFTSGEEEEDDDDDFGITRKRCERYRTVFVLLLRVLLI